MATVILKEKNSLQITIKKKRVRESGETKSLLENKIPTR